MSISKAFDAELTGDISLISAPAPAPAPASASAANSLPPTATPSSTLPVGDDVHLTLSHDGLLIIDTNATPSRLIPYFNILWADVMHDYVTIKFAQETSKDIVTAESVFYPFDIEHKIDADAWCERLLSLAYGKAQRQKRLKILVNPFGGKGHATQIYYKDIEPILAAAHCEIDVEQTKYSGHAIEIAEKLDIDAYDVIAACSGDGIPFEVFNGLAKKPNAAEALRRLPVVNIPCGSGNAMSCNLNGTNSPSVGALCVVKGIRTPLDLVSITQGDRRTLSFLSQSFGIIAESDLGTENVRWMGAARFTYGFLVRLLRQTCWPCDLAVKMEISSKQEIKDYYLAKVKEAKDRLAGGYGDDDSLPSSSSSSSSSLPFPLPPSESVSDGKGLPPLRYGRVTDPLPDGWKLIPYEKMGNFYAGNMAYMSPNANFFTCALPNDGMIDLITISGDCPRRIVLNMMFALEDNTLFDMPEVGMQKVSGYRLIPRQKEGYISVDGEKLPFEPFQAEVHKGLGTTLSRSGYAYAAPGPIL
ncbi:sphinganine kinase lcb4 [Ascosphaera aggregata]|nr:sphinganine kinase lcb4 [Ascosphaera aggregata]